MRKYKIFVRITIIALFFFNHLLFAQVAGEDSLRKLLPKLQGKQKIRALNHLAYLLRHSSAPIKTEEYAQKALEISLRMNDSYGVASSYANIGHYFFAISNYQQAYEYFLKAHDLFVENKHLLEAAESSRNMGNVLRRQGKYKEADRHYDDALVIFQDLNDQKGIANILSNQGQIAIHSNNNGRAKELLNKSLKVARKIGYKESEARSLGRLAYLYTLLNDNERALELLYKELELAKELKNQDLETDANNDIGKVLILLKNYDKAVDHISRALKLGHEMKAKERVLASYEEMANLYKAKGDFKQAYNYQLKVRAMEHKIRDSDARVRIASLKSQYEIKKTTTENSLLRQKVELNRFIIGGGIIFISIVVILGLFLVRSNRQKNTINQELINQTNALRVKQEKFELQNEELRSQKEILMITITELNQHRDHLEELVDERTLELTQSNEQLVNNLLRQTTLSEISSIFNSLDSFDEQVREVLHLLGGHTNVSRVSIYEDESDGEKSLNTFEWCRKGIESRQHKFRTLIYARVPYYKKVIEESGIFIITDADTEGSEAVQKSLKAQGVKSLLVAPLYVQGKHFGLIGFDECLIKRNWSENEIELIKTIANIISNAYEKRLAYHNLRQTKEQAQKSEAQLKLIYNNTHELMTLFKVEEEGMPVLESTNQHVIEMFAFRGEVITPAELIGVKIDEYYKRAFYQDDDKLHREIQRVKRVLKKKQEVLFTDRLDLDGGKVLFRENRLTPIINEQGDCTHLLIISRDITKNRIAKAALKESETRLKLAIEAAHQGLWDWDIRANENYLSPDFYRILGYQYYENPPIPFKPDYDQWLSHVHPDDRPKVANFQQRYLDEEIPKYEVELRIRCKDGSYKWVASKGQIVQKNRLGIPIRMVGIINDITERKHTDELLRRSEEQMKMTVQNVPVMINALDEKLNFVMWNAECERITGYSSQEITGNRRVFQMLIPDDKYRKKVYRQWLVRKGDFKNWEVAIICKDGTEKIISWTQNSKHYPIAGWAHWGVGVDVTDRNKALYALRDSEETLKLAMNAAKQGLWDWDTKNNKYNSFQYYHLLGYRPNEFEATHENWVSLIHPDDVQNVLNTQQRYLTAETPDYSLEYRMRAKKGTYKWFFAKGKTVARDEQGRPERMIGIISDISELKQATQSLRESERQLSTLMSNLPGMVYRCHNNQERPMVFVSEGSTALTGITPEEFIEGKRKFNDIILPEHKTILWEEAQTALKENRPFEVEYPVMVDGQIKWLWEKGRLTGQPGDVKEPMIEGFIADITDRKNAQEELIALKNDLERQVTQRTKELRESNHQLSLLLQESQENAETLKAQEEELRQNVEQLNKTNVALERKQQELNEAHSRFELIHQGIGEGLWEIFVPQNKKLGKEAVAWVSPKMLNILGITSPDNHIDLTAWHNKIHPEERQEVIQRFETYINNPDWIQPYFVEYRMLMGNGEYHWFRESGIVARDEYGNPSKVAGSLINIHEKKHAEEALRESEARLQYALEATRDGLYDIDMLEDRTFASSNYYRMLGFEPDEFDVNGQVWRKLLHHEDKEKVIAAFDQYKELNFPFYSIEYRMQCKDGEYKWFLDRGKAVEFSQVGKAIRTIGTMTNIDERKRYEEDLQSAKAAAEAASQAKSVFLASMSHDLRTPLNGILGYAQILKKEKNITPPQRDGLQIIERSGEQLLLLINDILHLSKIESGKLELENNDFNFADFVKNVVSITRVWAENKNIDYRFESPAQLPYFVNGDEKRIRQILFNLLSNAIKFTDEGGVAFRITHTPHPTKVLHHIFVFEVEDTGTGIPKDTIAKIFEPFHQVRGSRHQAEGTGLGLAICNRLVKLMDGSIQVESTLGKGSLFRLTIDMPVTNSELPQPPQEERNIVGYQGDTIKLLVVDDREENRMVLNNMLSPLGFEVYEAIDGEDAVNKTREYKPECVIMDLVMPNMDGFEAVKLIREDANLKGIKIIACSASVYDYDRDQSVAVGCNDFVPKPVNIAEMLTTLARHLAIEWVYEQALEVVTNNSAKVVPQNKEMIFPSQEVLQQIYKLALIGDVESLVERLTGLEEQDEGFVPFVAKIRTFAREYKMKLIRQFIKSHLKTDE
ncbi:PAS domain-containing protein [uncultured Microscilla sp.]|uniref:PAS domain-containing protein n=1 Tax=uncultured Microscilla sp. TaxID=432653 RepID=UPI002633948A|nr:PAS domain-containing protein [uncultured Microscilla sp.]